jgi:hypothetical protein
MMISGTFTKKNGKSQRIKPIKTRKDFILRALLSKFPGATSVIQV